MTNYFFVVYEVDDFDKSRHYFHNTFATYREAEQYCKTFTCNVKIERIYIEE